MKNIIHITIVAVSIILLFLGNNLVESLNRNNNLYAYYYPFEIVQTFSGTVAEIFYIEHDQIPMSNIGDDGEVSFINVNFTSIVFMVNLGRSEGGRQVVGIQQISDITRVPTREVEVGDRIILQFNEHEQIFELIEFVRINYIIIFGLIIIVAVLFFGKKQGLNSIIALLLTLFAIFWVFIPAILAGVNIYIATLLVCFYSIITTILIVIGLNKKSISSMVGCLTSVIIAALFIIIMDSFLELTGMLSADYYALLYIENPITDLRSLLFAGITIGVVGAVMDVSMSISSSLWEVKQTTSNIAFKDFYNAGLNIGKDILGTMSNTLILAYIGSSLGIILVLTAETPLIANLFHTEMIIAELLRATIGIAGIFLAIPITTMVCSLVYSKDSA